MFFRQFSTFEFFLKVAFESFDEATVGRLFERLEISQMKPQLSLLNHFVFSLVIKLIIKPSALNEIPINIIL